MSFDEYREEYYDLIAGTTGAIAGILVGMPFDLIKTRLQSGLSSGPPLQVTAHIFRTEGITAFWKGIVPPLISNVPINALGFATFGQAERYLTDRFNTPGSRFLIPTPPIQYQHDFYRNEAVSRYGIPTEFLKCYDGLQPKQSQSQSQISGSFSPTLTTLAERPSTQDWWAVFWAGCWSGFLACIISTPSDLLKIQEQNTIGKASSSTISIIKEIVTNHGVMSLFRGFWVSVVRDAPSVGLYFLSYHWIKSLLRNETWTPQVIIDGKIIGAEESQRFFEQKGGDQGQQQGHNHQNQLHTGNIRINWEHNITHSWWVPLAAGSIAGPLGWTCTYPVDVVKTVLQSKSHDEYKKTTMMKCFRQLLAQHGWKYFTKGLGTTAVGAIPMNAATFLTYEMTLKWCRGMGGNGSSSLNQNHHHHQHGTPHQV